MLEYRAAIENITRRSSVGMRCVLPPALDCEGAGEDASDMGEGAEPILLKSCMSFVVIV